MSKEYTTLAYDKNGQPLGIDTGVGGVRPCQRTILFEYVKAINAITKLGAIMDGERAGSAKRRVAYFRTFVRDLDAPRDPAKPDGVLKAIYVTMYGRESGIRDYQTRRPEDNSGPVQILGYVPLHTRPRIIRMDAGYQLIVGEGDPAATATPGRREDQWGYPIVCVATCRRVTLNRTNGAWWGYTYENHITGESLQLRGHRAKMVRAGLTKVGFEMLNTRGRDITRW